MKKKILSLLLVALMIVSLLPVTAAATTPEHPANDHTGWTVWNTHNSLPATAGNYYLTTDVTLNDTWTVPADNVSLCLNNHVINLNGKSIEVSGGATLNLYECQSEQSHAGTYAALPKGGCITGGNGASGGAILVQNGSTLNMYGGNIVNNQMNPMSYYGGGVAVQYHSYFNMYGGTITQNKAYASSIMFSGIGTGGGVYVDGSSSFTMTGGIISENTADKNGGGVYVGSGGTIILGGTAKITGNTVGTEDSETTDNLYLFSGTTVTLGTEDDAPTTDGDDKMSVGVTMQNPGVFITDSGSNALPCFFADDDANYCVEYSDGHLQLAKKYPVWIAGVQVTAGDVFGDGMVTYTPDATNPDTKGTLTLNDATLATDSLAYGASATSEAGRYSVSGIKSELPDLTVALQGTNQIGKDNSSTEE